MTSILMVAAVAAAQFFNDVRIPMQDGITLAADVYLPTNRAAKIGTFLSFSPYKATASDKPFFPARAEDWGVATVAIDCRGTCHSEGFFEPWEARLVDDADAVLNWIAAQPWSNGRVVMIGGSYPGATQLACMRSGNPALVACAPSVVTFNPYTINYANGVLVGAFFQGWHTGLANIASWAELSRHGDPNDPYWVERCSLRNLAKSKARAFYQAGWFDMLGVDTFETFAKMPEGSFLRIGPWSHGVNTCDKPDVNYGELGGMVTEDLELDFLRTALEGKSPATAKLPGKILMYTMGRNVWHYENEWPLKRMTPRKLWFGAGKTLAWKPGKAGSVAFKFNPANPVPTLGGRIIQAGGQYDQRKIEKHPDVVLFDGPVLDEELELTGEVKASVLMTASAPKADVTVKLVDVCPDGRALNVMDGICRGDFKPGKPTRLDFRVDITSYVFLKGHKLRVEIAGSNSRHYDRLPTPSKNSLLLGGENGSYLVLPVVPNKR